MKLSEMMMLGSTTCRMVQFDLNTCAIGAAANAAGIPGYNRRSDAGRKQRFDAIMKAWPWLLTSNPGYSEIARIFDYDVCTGRMTFEQLVDYVLSIEPECGTCNQFDCTCHKTTGQPIDETIYAVPA